MTMLPTHVLLILSTVFLISAFITFFVQKAEVHPLSVYIIGVVVATVLLGICIYSLATSTTLMDIFTYIKNYIVNLF